MRDFGLAVLAGAVIGVAARVLMRVVALAEGGETGFDPGASAYIVGVFVLAAAGGFLSGRAARAGRTVLAVVALALVAPLVVTGGSIGIVEISEHVGGDGVVRGAAVVVLAVVIFGCMAAAPLAGWRLARRP